MNKNINRLMLLFVLLLVFCNEIECYFDTLVDFYQFVYLV